MKKNESVAEEKKKSLFNSFWQLYKFKDINKITVTEICKNANYDRTTFYRYFLDIEDILNQFEDDIIISIKSKIESSRGNKAVITYDKFKYFSDKYGEYIVIFYDKGNRCFYFKFKDMIINDVYNYLNLNIQSDDKKDFLYEFLFSSIITSYAYWYKNPHIMSLESFTKLMNGMVMNGSRTILSYTK